jgi:hypothetical protein
VRNSVTIDLWRSLTRRARYLLVVVGAAAVIAFLLFNYKQRDSYYCQMCFSKKDVFQWRLGSWVGMSIPLTPSWERITETRLLHDFLPHDHVHDWMFAQGSPYHFFGTTWRGCAIGSGRHVNELCQMYDSSSEFRTFIKAKVRDGSLAKSNVIALMSRPRSGEDSALKEQSDALLESFFGK